MWISDLINGLDDALKFVLPDEVVEKVVDPFTDAVGGAVNGATGDWAGAARNLLDLAEDFAQWAGKTEAARRIAEISQTVGSLLEPGLSPKFASGAVREVAVRAAAAAGGAGIGAAAKGSVEGAATYARMLGGLSSSDSAALFDDVHARVRKLGGAMAGASVGAALYGEQGLKVGLETGVRLGERIDRLTTAKGAELAWAAAGTAARTGGILAGIYLAHRWEAWNPHDTTRPNLDAFRWAAGAGAAVDEIGAKGIELSRMEARAERVARELEAVPSREAADQARRVRKASIAARQVAGVAAEALRAAGVVAHGARIYAAKDGINRPPVALDAAAQVLDRVPAFLGRISELPANEQTAAELRKKALDEARRREPILA